MNAGAVWRYMKHCVRQYGRDNCPQLAAAISYYVLFSIVPLTLVLVSVFGLIIRSERLRSEVVQEVVDSIGLEQGAVNLKLDEHKLSERLTQNEVAALRNAIAEMTPGEREAVAASLRSQGEARIDGVVLQKKEALVSYDNAVSDTLNSVAGASAPLTGFSLLFSAWSASAMFGAVRRALNVVWKVEYERPYLQQKLWDVLMVGGGGALFLASVAGTGALRTLREISDEALGPLSTGTGIFWGALPYVLPGIFSFAVFALLYRFVPASKVRFRDVWLGALVAAVLFELLKNGFAFYVTHFRSYDLLYGSLGGILLFLTAVYFASSILLMGGEMAAAMPALAAGAFAPVPSGRPKVGLVQEIRREVLRFLRGLVLSPRPNQPPQDHATGHADRAQR